MPGGLPTRPRCWPHRVLSTPLGATVKEGGTTLGTTPFTLERPASNRTLVLAGPLGSRMKAKD